MRPLPTAMPTRPAPTTEWVPDVLGPGFMTITLPLGFDFEGAAMATLVAHRSAQDPELIPGTPPTAGFACLYIHGWNDYFFHREVARHVALSGGAFYALDLRKYGRSLRPGQSPGYVTDLSAYDQDFSAALEMIENENPGLPVIFMAHSTGGLTTALWAHRHPGRLAGLALNSPWLAWQYQEVSRKLARPIVSAWAWRAPRQIIPMPSDGHVYSRSLGPWRDGDLPAYLQPFADDPAVTGWDLIPQWKAPESQPLRPAWLQAILRGHGQVLAGLQIDCPVMVWASKRSFSGPWDPSARRADAVLNVENIVRVAPLLGDDVTIRRFESRHDIFLSDPDVRIQVWDSWHRWVRATLGSNATDPTKLGSSALRALCP
ncbi:MAG: alpha/beta hydrolase [Actinomycetaceae bacterium]|nr:alpha/beta hydrolase [Actinomycetaceae bacterium]